MKLTIRNHTFRAAHTLDSLIETRLLALAGRVRIDDATVLVEHRADASPPFRVEIHVAVPGPDLRTERIDNTPVQAFTRAVEDIENRLRERSLKRLGRSSSRAHRTSRHMRSARICR